MSEDKNRAVVHDIFRRVDEAQKKLDRDSVGKELTGFYDQFLGIIRLYGDENEILTPSDAVYIRALMRKVILGNQNYSKNSDKLSVVDETFYRWALDKYGIEPNDFIEKAKKSASYKKNGYLDIAINKLIIEEIKKKRLQQEDTFPSDRV